MASPTRNSVDTTFIDVAATGLGRYLIDGEKWGGELGTGVQLTYSFPGATAWFVRPYEEFLAYSAMSTAEQGAIRSGLAAWSKVSGVSFQQLPDNSSTVGELRFASTEFSRFAHAYLPGPSPYAGDIWFSSLKWNENGGGVPRGSYDYLTVLHEIGHALGLKHSFEKPNPIPSSADSYFSTIMSYTASPWSANGNNYASFYPTTPMYYDLVAIQALYGRNEAHNKGNTTYTFNDGQTYFQTIDDAGGTDTIVFNGLEAARIDLRIGQFSRVSEAIEFDGGVTSRNTVWIGPETVIERAWGGSGNDVLLGNEVRNVLIGRNGNDVVSGLGGNDVLSGGAGNDRLNGGAGGDTLVGSLGRDILNGGGDRDRFDFNSLSDSGLTESTRDLVVGFVVGVDILDFSTIDASRIIAGNNTFVWRGTSSFTNSAEGEIRYTFIDKHGTAHDRTIVHIDNDADRGAEMQISLVGLVNLSEDDVIL